MNFRIVWMGSDDDRQEAAVAAHVPTSAAKILKYERRGQEMVRVEELAGGRRKLTVLTNFWARIVRDIVLDEGDRETRLLGIEVDLGESKSEIVLSGADFNRMDWTLNKLGPQAIIYPGQQQHARAAIQSLSSPIRQEHLFLHLGWRKNLDRWIYLHADGALGANGPIANIRVQPLPALGSYGLQPTRNPEDGVNAVKASLRCLNIAPDHISFPLLAAVYRAPFGNTDFSIFLVGRSGVFKTALAAICQQHFGAQMDAHHLPANFASTANALESLGYCAKDTLLVVDDFAPAGNHDHRIETIAERLFRSAGNQQGRTRMNGSGCLDAPRVPRALILATGEKAPSGQSIRARLVMVDIALGDVDPTTLGQCQLAADQGCLAKAMGCFVSWIAGRFGELQENLRKRVTDVRRRGLGRHVHARLPGALAELQVGWELFLEFAVELGAIEMDKKRELEQRQFAALEKLVSLQARHHLSIDPAQRFISLLKVAIASGHAHIANRLGKTPESPATWGWKCDQPTERWTPQGVRIGCIAGADVFLDPTAGYEIAQSIAGTDPILLGPTALHRELRARGFLASVDVGRQMVQVRRTIDRIPRRVLHLRARDLR